MGVLCGSGSGCELDFAKGKVNLALAERTDIVVKGGGGDFRRDFGVELRSGEVEAHIREKGVRFDVSTSVGTARAVGTRFRVKLISERKEKEVSDLRQLAGVVMLTTVISGVVEVAGPFGIKTAVAGDTLVVTEGSAAGGGVTVVVGEEGGAIRTPATGQPGQPANPSPGGATGAWVPLPAPVDVTLTGKLTKEVKPIPANEQRAGSSITEITVYTLTVADGRTFRVNPVRIGTPDGKPSYEKLDLTPFVDQEVTITGKVPPNAKYITSITSIAKTAGKG